MKAKTLVQAWLDVALEQEGLSLADALRELNGELDTAYTHSRVREWEENRNGRGGRLPRAVRTFMLRKSVRAVLDAAGLNVQRLNDRQLGKIAEQLS